MVLVYNGDSQGDSSSDDFEDEDHNYENVSDDEDDDDTRPWQQRMEFANLAAIQTQCSVVAATLRSCPT